MKPSKQYGISNLFFWIILFHIPLVIFVANEFFGNLLSEPKYENQAVIGVIAIIFSFLSMTAWLYTPAFILSIWIMDTKPPEIAMVPFCYFSSCQAFIMALSIWLFKRAKAHRLMKIHANTPLEPTATPPLISSSNEN